MGHVNGEDTWCAHTTAYERTMVRRRETIVTTTDGGRQNCHWSEGVMRGEERLVLMVDQEEEKEEREMQNAEEKRERGCLHNARGEEVGGTQHKKREVH